MRPHTAGTVRSCISPYGSLTCVCPSVFRGKNATITTIWRRDNFIVIQWFTLILVIYKWTHLITCSVWVSGNSLRVIFTFSSHVTQASANTIRTHVWTRASYHLSQSFLAVIKTGKKSRHKSDQPISLQIQLPNWKVKKAAEYTLS